MFTTAWVFLASAVGGSVVLDSLQYSYGASGSSGGIFAWQGMLLADVFVNWELVEVVLAKHGPFPYFKHCWLLGIVLILSLDFDFWNFWGCKRGQWMHIVGMIFGFCLGVTTAEDLNSRCMIVATHSRWRDRVRCLLMIAPAALVAVMTVRLLKIEDSEEIPDVYYCIDYTWITARLARFLRWTDYAGPPSVSTAIRLTLE
jgi:hypothetical protein